MPDARFNLRHLRAFAEVARQGGVSKASAVVHLSQPAVTQALAKLEARLGAALFDRTSGGMVATAEGAAFQTRVDRALEILAGGFRDAASAAGVRDGAASLSQATTTQLLALIAVSKHGSFTLAARAQGGSQPAIHRMARGLEQVCGFPLFHRTGRGVAPTRAAALLAARAGLAASELRQGVEEVETMRGAGVARLAVGSLPLARSAILPRALDAVANLRSAIAIQVLDGAYDDLLAALRCGEIDLIVGALRDPPPIADVRQEALFDDRLSVVASAGHPLAGRTEVEAAELCEHPWATPRRGTPARAAFDRYFEAAGAPRPPRLAETGSLVLVRALLEGGGWLAMISAHQVRADLRAGRLVRLPIEIGDAPRPIGVATRLGWRPTALQAAFLEALAEASKVGSAETSSCGF